MEYSISHDLANFIDYGNRLLRRLKTEGAQLSEMERRILLTHLRKLSTAAEQLQGSRSESFKKDAA
jgi:hypothetical protein